MNTIMPNKVTSFLSGLRRRSLFVTAISLSVTAVALSQQNDRLISVYNRLQSYSCAYAQQERLFLFLNSGFYYPGENIAFRAVLFDSEMKIKTNGSRFFYLQLLNASGTSIGNYTFELHSGECSGSVKIPDTLVTGLYTLKAYTRWMQNYSSANYFRRPFLVISPLDGTMLQTPFCDSLPVRLYPESGSFIEGIENTVLVKVNPCWHDSIRHVCIADDLEKVIVSGSLGSEGTAVFTFTPETGRHYHAVTADSSKIPRKYALPEPQGNGYGLHMEAGKDSLHIRIYAAPETKTGESLFLAIMSGNAEKSKVMTIDPVHTITNISIPLASLPSGISQVALFSNNTMVCSRVWYHLDQWVAENDKGLTDTLATRKLVSVPLPPAPMADRDHILAISLNEYNTVTDSILFDEINYFRYFELYSSFANPEILPLFNDTTSEEAVNNCLIATTKCLPLDFTLRNPEKLLYAKEVLGVILSGKVVFSSTGKPVKGSIVLLSFPDSVTYLNYSVTDENGEFSYTLNEKLFNRKVYLIVQGYPQAENSVTILPDDPFMIASSTTAEASFDHPAAEKVISCHKNIAMAFRVFYATKMQASLPVLHDQPSYRENFYGKPDFTLIPADYEFLPDIFEIRKNLIPRLKLKVRDDYCQISVFDDYLQMFYPEEAFVLLNNIPFPSLKNILELNSENIRSIELKSGKFFYDNYLMYGIVSVVTRKPVEVEPYYSYYIASVDVMSEQPEILFVNKPDEGTLPDVRHSLYWSTVPTSVTKMAEIRFRTSDIKGSYQLKVYAITTDGKLKVVDRVFTVL
jgi:hypothetical protein